MRKRVSRQTDSMAAARQREPLAEGPCQRRRPMGFLSGLSDEELVGYTEWVMGSIGIRTKMELRKADAGLHTTLSKRGILDCVEFEEDTRKGKDWDSMRDEEIIAYAQRIISEEDIPGRSRLNRRIHALYMVLWRRKLLDSVFPESKVKMCKKKKGETLDQLHLAVREYLKGGLKQCWTGEATAGDERKPPID